MGFDALTAAVLGAIQGVTEFLPVSSSGHIALGAAMFGLQENSLAFTVLLHLGTLVATIALLREDVGALIVETASSLRHPDRLRSTPEGRTVVAIVIATAITGVLGLTLRSTAAAFAENLRLVGVGFLISAAFLAASGFTRGVRTEVSVWMAAAVGVAQGIAVLPGISRSGVTISTAMLLGLAGPEAFRFSFLISLPAIAAAALLETFGAEGLGSLDASAWVGGLTALAVGYVSLLLLRRIIVVGRMWIFALYLVPLGLFLLTR